MKICRQLLSLILLFSCACATLGVDGSGGPAAVLYAGGKVQVNGADSRKISTLFSGDSIQTDADSVANIIARGSSVLVMPGASVKFLGNAVELTQGGNGDRHLGGDVRDGVWSNHYADGPDFIEI
jgi:ribosome-associated protein YbcJ (S4-like RNA binding protein)